MEYYTEKNTIPGWTNDTDLLWLFNMAKEMESVVEIGSGKGRSTHAILSACKGAVYAVDHFSGNVDEPEIYKEFVKNVGSFKNLEVLKMTSEMAVRQFEDGSVDMVFIDGNHSYEEVLADIKRWLPKAKKIICGHARRNWQVKKAVREVFENDWNANEGRGNMWIKSLDVAHHKNLKNTEQSDTPRNGWVTNKTDLSILIPAKNEEFLKKTVEDILANIEGNTEVIVVLDGYDTALPIMPEDTRVRVITNPVSLGQRGATNQACKLSKAKYVMKADAHCAFDKGFDVKMMKEMEGHDNWTMVPVMRNLHAFNWVCPDGHVRYQGPSGPCAERGCGKPTVKDVVWIAKSNPQSTSYCFDQEPHFQYFNDFRKRPEAKGDITETMSIQGSCFMLTREKYWELNISDEAFGSWGSQGIEVACKTWLSGGRVVVNHKTWYAHMFRTQGGDFGFPYENPGRKVENAKKTARELFFDNKWEKQIYPLSWLLEKFWPVPGWTEEARAKIKAWPLQNGKPSPIAVPASEAEPTPMIADSIQLATDDEIVRPPQMAIAEKKKPTAGIIYYTDNELDEKIMKACQKQLLKASGGKKIVSVSLKPIDFGQNIVLPLSRGSLTMFKQILFALLAIDTDIVFFCEHDILYPQSHFDFIPPDRNVWYYNGNYWFLRLSDGHALHYDASSLSGLCVYRDIAIKHYQERIALVEKEGFSRHIGYEPMTHKRIPWENTYKFEIFKTASPIIDIKHGKNLTGARWSKDKFRKKPTGWEEGNIDTIPGWTDVRGLLS
jgi:glycosyltransferase involved in cell wall biosynthesis/precorrin-6B methylase 2